MLGRNPVCIRAAATPPPVCLLCTQPENFIVTQCILALEKGTHVSYTKNMKNTKVADNKYFIDFERKKVVTEVIRLLFLRVRKNT